MLYVHKNHKFTSFNLMAVLSYSFKPKNYRKFVNVKDIEIINAKIKFGRYCKDIQLEDISYSYDNKRVLITISPKMYYLPKHDCEITIEFTYVDKKYNKIYHYKEKLSYNPLIIKKDKNNNKRKK